MNENQPIRLHLRQFAKNLHKAAIHSEHSRTHTARTRTFMASMEEEEHNYQYHTNPQNSITMEDAVKCFHVLTMESNVVHAYNTFNSPIMRDMLCIPHRLWVELEPRLQQEIQAIREHIQKAQRERGDTKPAGTPMMQKHPQDSLPSQYPTMKAAKKPRQEDQEHPTSVNAFTSMSKQHVDMLEEQCAQLCNVFNTPIKEESDDEDSLETVLKINGFMAVTDYRHADNAYYADLDDASDISEDTPPIPEFIEIPSIPIDVTAYFNLVHAFASRRSDDEPVYALADCGADACILGKHAHILAYTGHYANIVGYDPATTMAKKVPIVTAIIKAISDSPGRIPVLLKVHEAPYIKDNPHALISEYQVREYGLICDSTAKKHRGSHGFGTQRLYLNEDLGIPFKDLGALMGFQLLPVEPDDLDRYEIHTITSDSHWCPRRFKQIEDPSFEQSSSYYNPQVAYNAVRQPDPPGSAPSIAYEDCSACYNQCEYCDGHFAPTKMDTSNVCKKCDRIVPSGQGI